MNTGHVRGEGSDGSRGKDSRRQVLRKKCVLIVEDDERIRELMTALMRSEGFEAVELGDGMEALSYLAASAVYGRDLQYPDLIIADIMMPNYSGLDLLMGMRESSSRPPVMLVTGIADDEIHAEARRLGAARVVKKPFGVEHFLNAVDDCLASPSIEAVVEPEIVTVDVDW